MEEINRFYIRKTDFQSKDEFNTYLNNLINTLTKVDSNIVVAYQSMDPNVYIIECNTQDPTLNGVFPFWVTPSEMMSIKQYRENPKKIVKKAQTKDDDFGGFPGGEA